MRKIPTVNTDLRILRLIYCQSQKYSGTVNDLRNLDNNLNTLFYFSTTIHLLKKHANLSDISVNLFLLITKLNRILRHPIEIASNCCDTVERLLSV